MEVPLAVPDVGAIALQLLVLEDGSEHERAFVIHSRVSNSSAEWTRHASGTLAEDDEHERTPASVWPPEGAEMLVLDGAYERLGALGLDYGPSFHGLKAAWRRGEELFAEIELPSEVGSGQGYAIHPVLFDAALHALALRRRADDPVELPFAWSGVRQPGESVVGGLRVRTWPVDGGVEIELRDELGARGCVGRAAELARDIGGAAAGGDSIGARVGVSRGVAGDRARRCTLE